MTKGTRGKQEFEPVIIALACNWCSYTGADLAGISRCQYPTNVRIVRVMCSGMVAPSLVIEALTKGADGVVVCGCHLGDCHYQDGNVRAQNRAEAITMMLQDFGIEEGRFKLAWVSAAEGPQFANLMTEFTEQIRQLGPNPNRGPRKKEVETMAEVS
jgi:F420-non-reducing hydrogenase iron-sulfur subunit